MLSESDMDLSFSMDEDVIADVQKLKASKSTAPVPKKNAASFSASSYKNNALHQSSPIVKSTPISGTYQSALLVDTDDDSSSMQIGKQTTCISGYMQLILRA